MPASPSFPSGTRGNRWKRRKRDPQPTRKAKEEDEDDDEEDEPEAELDDENNNHHPDDNNSNPDPNPNPKETEVLSEDKVPISDFPPVFRRVVDRPHSSVLAVLGEGRSGIVLENVSYGQLQALSAVPPDCPSLGDPDAGEGSGSCSGPVVAMPPRIMEGRGVVKRFGSRVLLVPMYSEWFSPATVHRLERQVVPHFFSGKSVDYTPEKYMECRNHIVARYMENPEKRLTVSDCQGLVAGIQDDDLTRIVRFLDHWGIINYSAAAASIREPWNDGSYLKEDQNGEVHVPSAALKAIDSLIKFDKPKCRRKAADVYASSSHKDQTVLDLDSKIRERLSEHCCNHCSRPLLVVYYQSLKEVDVYLCSDCFHGGKFVIGHSSIDFIRTDSTRAFDDLDGESWTDQETLLLLEAMEIYNENWSEIAEHVGSKSKAQCILHFLRLPMEDGLLENIEVPGVCSSSSLSNGDVLQNSHSNVNSNGEGPLQDAEIENRIPFANSGNPVMALVAFLASAIAPRVAAACAHTSLAVLSAENDVAEPGNILQVEGTGPTRRSNAEAVHGTDSAQHKGGQNAADAATPVSPEKVKAAAKAGLAAAATKAKLFADHEEREIQRLSANIINHQLKRLELKLKQFAEVETLLMKECDQVERTRQRLAAERARVLSTRFGPAGTSALSNISGANPSLVNSNSSNNKQQGFSASPPQPSVSGLGSNQPLHPHPHMPFMQRQSMFPLGPRLPLSAVNPSSSAPSSNVMFNSPGSAQPTLNHSMLRSVSGTNSSLG